MAASESETTSFFKLILSSTLQEGKMKFPKKFAKEQGGELPETVRLCLPSGRCWSVRIEKETDNAIWLHDGLLKFVEDNSIGIEYILVFKYDGNSEFGVQIFDLTAAEIKYSGIDDSIKSDTIQAETIESENGSDNCARGGAESDDSVVECLGSSRVGVLQGTNKVRRSYFTRRRKQVMKGGIGAKRSPRRPSEAYGANEENVKMYRHGKNSTVYKDTGRNYGTNVSPSEPINKSSPNFFKVTLKPCYLEKDHLYVPRYFALLHMSDSTRLVKLVDGEDNEWLVRYTRYRGHQNFINSGWGRFVQEKKLMVGDVCIFKRVQGDDEVKLRVTISRSRKDHEESKIIMLK